MKLTTGTGLALALTLAISAGCAWCARDGTVIGAAKAAPIGRTATAKTHMQSMQGLSAITLPTKPHPSVDPERAGQFSWPWSVTLSPNGRWLAATSEDGIWVRDLKANRWIRNLRRANPPVIRWHPTKPVLIGTGGSADQPEFFIAYPSSGKRSQLFRSDPDPFAWTTAGMLVNRAIVGVDADTARTGKSGNFGFAVPWDYGDKAQLLYMLSGPRDQVAAEVRSLQFKGHRPPRRVETYRKVPGRRQWVRSGTVHPEVKEQTVVWHPRNPNWLGDGRLVYLRIYPAEWTHASTNGPGLNPKAGTARNRAELWVCDANGKGQRKITTLWDLRVSMQEQSSDWFTIDRSGTTLYYLSWDKIKVMKFKKPI